jgi:hypothetical protein
VKVWLVVRSIPYEGDIFIGLYDSLEKAKIAEDVSSRHDMTGIEVREIEVQ